MSTSFADLGVPQSISRALAAKGITSAFPIQVATIPDGIAGRDLCGKAATGSGKTIAFGIPMVMRVKRAAPKRPKGLVLAPTRELALQVADELRSIGGDLRVLAVYGGAGIEPQLKALRNGVDIVVACPGRLLDVIDRKACDLRDVSFVVVDEADRMADMGFLPDVRRILDQTAADRQTVLFSATLDGAIDALVRDYQVDPVVHEMPEEDKGDVAHHFWLVERPERTQLAAEVIERAGPTVVFSRTRHGADRIARQLEKLGVSAAAIHGSRSQGQRERALNQFHEGRVKALVATDVAARGIHVEGVACVIHFDLPADHKDYVHRSGRTGRAGATGVVVALLGGAQRKDATKLLRDADVDARITPPDVASLPAGHAGFAAALARPARPGRTAANPKSNHQPRRDKPAAKRSRPEGGGARAGSGRSFERHDTDRRTDGPRSARPTSQRTDRPTTSSRAGSAGSRPERPERGRPGSDRPQRTDARPKRPENRPAAAGGPSTGERTESRDQLDRVTAGSAKVRPSGASRRKAKREALLAAGVDPRDLPAKKRRR